MEPLQFPKWLDRLKFALPVVAGAGGLYVTVLVYAGANPRAINIGYMPEQPIRYSHALHAGELKLDCRYCHNTVERAGHAAIPPTATCMNCHATLRVDSPEIRKLRDAHRSGKAIQWVKVHDLPDYVFFNHSAHVRRGVGCAECHGRVDKMDVVRQERRLTMGWCLNCHRQPEGRLREPDQVTNMAYDAGAGQAEQGAALRKKYDINPSTDCWTCHR